ncbi:MAG: Thermophilic serine proteinase [Anaerolineales bacterium]|nr:Thermophilic serine proteinase [Anaerolineales bacterium]
MLSIRRSVVLAVALLVVAAGIGRLSVASADPPDPQAYIDGFPARSPSPVEPHPASTPDPDDLWNLSKIGIPCDPPHDDFMSVADTGAVVAVIDTGVDPDHPLLVDRLVPGYDFVNHDPDPSDDQGHGTHVAGIIAQVAPPVEIMPVKALSASGAGAHSWIANAIIWATDHGAHTINMSLGGPYPSTTMHNAVEYAWSHGVVMAAAAGNNGSSIPIYPAAYPEVMGVAATTQDDERAEFSSYGDHVFVAAPGVWILSTIRGGSYQPWSGTAMATAHVSALAGLVKSYYPTLDGWQIREAIERGADDLGTPGWDPIFGHGRINVCRTLEIAQTLLMQPISPTAIPLVTPTPPTE